MEPNSVLGLSEEALIGYDLLRAECGRFELQQSALFELTGEDRKGWLQGQITYDLRGVVAGSSLSFCMCSPTGQMIVYGDLWALENSLLIRIPKLCVEAFTKRCEQAIVMEDVTVKDLTEEYKLFSIQGPTASSELREFFELPTLDAGTADFEGVQILVLRSNRTGLGGWDLLLPVSAEAQIEKLNKNFESIHEDAFNVARLEAGNPKYGTDMDAKTLPPEMGPYFVSRTVSYTKGCYTGQEVLQRIHSRGHTNKTWMGIYCDGPVSAEDKVFSGNKEVGVITSVGDSPKYGFIAGAMLKNEAAFSGEEVIVHTASGEVTGEVTNLPFLNLE
jgi:folate-binding protein YgfZ